MNILFHRFFEKIVEIYVSNLFIYLFIIIHLLSLWRVIVIYCINVTLTCASHGTGATIIEIPIRSANSITITTRALLLAHEAIAECVTDVSTTISRPL